MKAFFIFTSVLLLIFSVVGNLEATPYSWDFVAQLDSTATATGTFGWDDSAADQYPGGTSQGLYYTGFLTASVSGGVQNGQTFNYIFGAPAGDGDAHVRIDFSLAAPHDNYNIAIGQYTNYSEGYWTGRLVLTQLHPPASITDALPTSINLSDFFLATVVLGDTSFLQYNITSISASAPVPEPATMLLLASGLVGLAGLRRKLRNN